MITSLKCDCRAFVSEVSIFRAAVSVASVVEASIAAAVESADAFVKGLMALSKATLVVPANSYR